MNPHFAVFGETFEQPRPAQSYRLTMLQRRATLTRLRMKTPMSEEQCLAEKPSRVIPKARRAHSSALEDKFGRSSLQFSRLPCITQELVDRAQTGDFFTQRQFGGTVSEFQSTDFSNLQLMRNENYVSHFRI